MFQPLEGKKRNLLDRQKERCHEQNKEHYGNIKAQGIKAGGK